MIEKDITIVESELKSGAKGEYITLTDHEGVRFSCFNQHKDLWDYLGKDMSSRIGFETKGVFKNITEATPMAAILPVGTTAVIQPEHIIAPQEIGMWWKELGEMLRANDIDKTHPMYHDFRNKYYQKMSEVLGIPIRHETKKED